MRVRVRAQNEVGYSSWTHPLEFLVPSCAPLPPGNVSLKSVSTHTLHRRTRRHVVVVTWDPPAQLHSSALVGYEVEYVIRSEASASDCSPSAGHHPEGVRAAEQIRRTQRINAVSTGTTLSGLTPGDAIQVRVRAVNSVGPSAYTAPVCCSIHESVMSSVNRSDGGSTW